MAGASASIESLLARDLVLRHPGEAADHLAGSSPSQAAEALSCLPPVVGAEAVRALPAIVALDILTQSDPTAVGPLLLHLSPSHAGALLSGLSVTQRASVLRGLSSVDAAQLSRLAEYPPESAGSLQDPRIPTFRITSTVASALEQLRRTRRGQSVSNLFVVDDSGRLVGAIPLHEAALADPADSLRSLIHGPPIAISPFAKAGEVIETMERNRLHSLPVVGPDGIPTGVLRLNEILHAVGKELSSDLVSLTGASSEETALSSVVFAVRKRLPWLQINLVTAFLAAAVVGLFEETIAQFTALAVLLPVVAGQSGNTGSQALAVVIRGLALREITLRHWRRVVAKELVAGLLNGIGVGVVTCAGVYLWSGSIGLVLVIGTAMILSMTIAGVAGAIIPVLLGAFGQDPAQSSSILLTTVTDVFGFLSFLGLATLLSGLL